MKKATLSTPIIFSALVLGACSNGNKPNADTKDTAVVVNKVEATTKDTVVKDAPAAASAAPLSTQSGPNGFEIDLTKADVNGSILTVEFKYRNTKKSSTNVGKFDYISSVYKASAVNYIDDATAKKYSVLKDQDGKYMASPLQNNSTEDVMVRSDGDGTPAMAYFRFPAPPAGTKTISVSIPEAGAFNGIPVTFK